MIAGIWVAGGVITDDFRLSMALTAAWFAIVASGAFVVWRQRRDLRLAAVAAVGAFVLVGGWLVVSTFRDKVVHERLVTAPTVLAGSFRSLAHGTSGTAQIVRRPDGTRLLQLVGLRTSAGPDLFVYVVPGRVEGSSIGGGARVGRLKGNLGDQEYTLDPGVGADPSTVVIWCRAFSVAFGAAPLSGA